MSNLICESVTRDDGVPIRFVSVWANIDHSNNIVRSSGGLSTFTDIATGRGRLNFTDIMFSSTYATSGCANEGTYKDSATTRSAGVVGPITPLSNAFSTSSFSFQTSAYTPDADLDCREVWIHIIG